MYPGAWLWLLLTVLALCRAADWGDWIIVDEAEAGTSVLLRRITPKSVFVAPTFGCSEGYRQDSLGRCVKHVKVNQAEQWKFYLERLNSMFAPSATSKKPQKEAGPFHISLPIGSEQTQEDVVVKKRLPPLVKDQRVETPPPTRSTQPTTTKTIRSTTTTTALPQTTTAQEFTTPEATQPSTMIDLAETTNTERELTSQTEITTETRKKYETTELESAVMLGDQPVSTEDLSGAETLQTPKNHSSQLPDKPFVIIVTNEPTVRAEETTLVPTSFAPPTTEQQEEETVSEASVTTEGTTETTLRFTTDAIPRPTEYDKRLGEIRDSAKPSIRPNMRFTSTLARPKCEPQDEDYDSRDCEPAETEQVSNVREVTNPSVSLAPSLPLLEPNTQVRFPSESFAPARKTQTFVRFPESTHPHDDRPALWWPSWQVRQHPAIRGWPPPEESSSEQVLHKQYPPFKPHQHPHPQSWSDSNAWRRRFFQRD